MAPKSLTFCVTEKYVETVFRRAHDVVAKVFFKRWAGNMEVSHVGSGVVD
jgi:hypothetical protein